ncbi:MAG: hypothetical protein ACI9Y7_003209, partial [Dokdonia sp.]
SEISSETLTHWSFANLVLMDKTER